MPVAGNEEIVQWVPLIRRIQDKKKSVCLSVTPPEIEPLLREIRPDGVLIRTRCGTEGEARQLMDRVTSMF